jgi:hypothetical protein
MYEQHSEAQSPKDLQAAIWRYTDFTKFVSLLSRRALFFSTAEHLGDPFEGSVPERVIQRRPEWEPRPGVGDVFAWGYREHRCELPISCWHLSEHESAAMWRLYLKSNEGVAIRSTFGRLCDSLRNFPVPVYIGAVTYLDYKREGFPEGITFRPLFHKRKSYEHERELRALVWTVAAPEGGGFHSKDAKRNGGLYIPVDVQELVERVYVAPTAPAWFKELVETVVDRWGLPRDLVVQSDLVGTPLY